MPKLKNDINSEYFHKKYLEKHDKLLPREASSHLLYNTILRNFFEYIKERIYGNAKFSTPIGHFEVRKIPIKPYQVDTLFKRKNGEDGIPRTHIYKVVFTCNPYLQGRYTFTIIQEFRNKIVEKYDIQENNITVNN